MSPLAQLPPVLLEWYDRCARTLPWRSDPTPYHVWVSEIMLQQTRVAAAMDYYLRFLQALPDVQALASCPEDRLMKLWQGLGYYSRARSLQKAARQIVEEFAGEFPQDLDAIRSLAGVGDYTAGAIASIAFGQAAPAVDGNVLRVISRLTDDHRSVGEPKVKREITAAVQKVIPLDRAGDFNQALMELGALICLPNGEPLCSQCPARDFCLGRQAGTARALPVKPAKKPRKIQRRNVYLIFYHDMVAIRRRPSRGLLAGLWEFPNEPAPWPCPVEGQREPAGEGKHVFTHIEWRMEAFLVKTFHARLPEGWVWAGREELESVYTIPSAFGAFLPTVARELNQTQG